jgi:predicted Zn-dependent protease with MMP-like domain
VIEISPRAFEDLVAKALDGMPPAIAAMFDNVVVMVEDELPDDPHLLGLYEGVPLTERDGGYGLMAMPDRITVFRLPICRISRTEADVIDEVRITVVHELGHHVGIDDDRLHQLGWG